MGVSETVFYYNTLGGCIGTCTPQETQNSLVCLALNVWVSGWKRVYVRCTLV